MLEAQFLEQRQDFAHLPVLHRDHRRISARFLGPRLVLVDRPRGIGVGDAEHAVWRRVGQVGKERLLGVLADELQRRVMDHVLRVRLAAGAAVVAGQRQLLAVADEIGRIVAVRVDLIVVAEEHIEAVLFRYAGRVASAAAPLAETAGGVAERLEHRGDGHLLRPQGRAAAVDSHRGMPAVFPREEAAPRRCANARPGEQVVEPDPLGGQAVNVGRLDIPSPHEPWLVVAQLIGHDVDDVRLGGGRRGSGRRQRGGRRQEQGGEKCESALHDVPFSS